MNIKTLTTAMALASASVASAGIVDLQYISMGPGAEVQLSEGSSSRDIFVGQLEHEISNAFGADAALNGTHLTFCADITQFVSASEPRDYYTEDIENMPDAPGIAPMGMMKADAIRALYNSAATTLAGTLTDAYAAAFQIVIYEIVDDFDGSAASIDASTGYIQAAGVGGGALDGDILAAMSALTTGMMAALGNGGGTYEGVIGLANATHQDQLVFVPAPGALALLGAGGFMASRRRRS